MKSSKKVRMFLGVMIIVCAMAFAYRDVVRVSALEKEEVDSVVLAEKFARRSSAKTLEKADIDDVRKNEAEYFFWNNMKNTNQRNIGFIKADKYSINAPLSFGGEDEQVLLGSCGIHRDLSDTAHITVLGHNCERYSKLKDKLFTNIKYLNVGDRVEMDTIYGLYTLTVEKTVYVNPGDYIKNNYAVLLEGDVTFATCEWRGKEKGRRVVYLKVESVE